MGKAILTSLIITLFSVFFLAGCAAKGQDDTQLLSGLNNRILETVLENDESGDTVTLSEEEISFFNTEFFNGPSFNPNNILLSGEYDNPQAIDFFQLFYNGTGKTTYQITEEEMAKLSELDSEAPYLDIVKVTTDDINAFLQEKLGMALEETQQTGLDSFYYLEEYNSYYLVHGDTNYNKCTVISGSWESDDTIRLLYEKENEEGQWIVTLQKSNDKYLFLSNSKK